MKRSRSWLPGAASVVWFSVADEVDDEVFEAIGKCRSALDGLIDLMRTCPYETEYERVCSAVGVLSRLDIAEGQAKIMLAIAANRLEAAR